MPAQDRELACQGDGGDLMPALCPDPDEEGVKWSRCLRGCPGGFDQHRTGVAAPDLADATMMSRAEARLAYTRIEPDIAHEFLRRGEAADVAYGRDQPRRDRHVDASDRDQPVDGRVSQGAVRNRGVEHRQILRSEEHT